MTFGLYENMLSESMADGPDKNMSLPPFNAESRDSAQPTGLFVDAPEYLAFGQNLFDQEPFAGVITGIQERLDLQGESYRDLFRVAMAVFLVMPDLREPLLEEWKGMSEQDVIKNKIRLRKQFWDEYAKGYPKIPIEERTTAAAEIAAGILDLLRYPLIVDYVINNQGGPDAGEYNRNGNLHRGNRAEYEHSPTETYAKWLSDQRQRGNYIETLATELKLREAFSNRELPILPPGVVQGRMHRRRKSGTRIT